jgi:hypothetical protein
VFASAEQIDLEIFNEKAKKNGNRRPDWFIDPSSTEKGHFEAIKKGRFYIARDELQKKIYFVLTN